MYTISVHDEVCEDCFSYPGGVCSRHRDYPTSDECEAILMEVAADIGVTLSNFGDFTVDISDGRKARKFIRLANERGLTDVGIATR